MGCVAAKENTDVAMMHGADRGLIGKADDNEVGIVGEFVGSPVKCALSWHLGMILANLIPISQI